MEFGLQRIQVVMTVGTRACLDEVPAHQPIQVEKINVGITESGVSPVYDANRLTPLDQDVLQVEVVVD